MSERSRREFVLGGMASFVGIWGGVSCRASERTANSDPGLTAPGAPGLVLAPTPACADGVALPTPRAIQGPFYRPRTPQRRNLRDSSSHGRPLRLVGRVLGTNCRPLPGAVLDFWQADSEGEYDNTGVRLRGHQFVDADGAYLLETVRPGAYGTGFFERTPHIHLRVQAPEDPLLTTQLYFPDAAERNARDPLYRDELLVTLLSEAGGVIEARFDVVLKRS